MPYNHFKLINTTFLSFFLYSLKAYPVHDFQIASVLRCLVRAPPLHESKRPHTKFSNETSLHILKYTGSNISKKSRSSRPEVFCKKGVRRNFAKFSGNTCARVSFLIKLWASAILLSTFLLINIAANMLLRK